MRKEVCGDELNFMYHELSLNDRFLKNRLLSSEVFYNHFLEIKRRGVHIDKALVYRELEKLLFPVIHGNLSGLTYKEYKSFKEALGNLSKILYGDNKRWKMDYEKEFGEPYPKMGLRGLEDGGLPDDLAYLEETCPELKTYSLRVICHTEETAETFRAVGRVTDVRYAYEVFKSVFFRIIKLGYKNSIKTWETYNNLRRVAEDFGTVLFADKNHWHEDYNKWLHSEHKERK